MQALVARALGRLEDLRQPFLELFRGLIADVSARGGGHAGDKVLHVAQVQAPVVGRVQVPGGGHEARDHLVLQLRNVPPRRAQVGHDLGDGEPLDGVRDVGEGGDQKQPHDVLGVLGGVRATPKVRVDGLGHGIAARRDVVGNGVLQGGVDLVDLGQGLAAVRIDVVSGNEPGVMAGIPDPRHDDPHQADQPAGLLEALVLPKAAVEVADGGMERIRLGDLGGELLGRGVRHVHLPGLAYGFRIRIRDLFDLRLVRKGLEDALAEDPVELVRVHADRLQIHRGAAGLRLQVVERGDDPRRPCAVGRLEIGDHQTDVAQLLPPDRDQEVRQRGGGHRGEVRVADALRGRVDEVGWQLVQHDDERFAPEQVHPRRLARRGEGRVVVVELLLPAELPGDGAPDAERCVALAPGEGDHADRAEIGIRRVEAAHDPGPVLGVPGQQAEREEVVGLAAAHGLGQLEHALRRFPFEAPEPLGEQGSHSLRNVVLGEESGRIDAAVDQIAKIEHGVAACGVEHADPRDTCLLDGLHGGMGSLFDEPARALGRTGGATRPRCRK